MMLQPPPLRKQTTLYYLPENPSRNIWKEKKFNLFISGNHLEFNTKTEFIQHILYTIRHEHILFFVYKLPFLPVIHMNAEDLQEALSHIVPSQQELYLHSVL